MIFAEAVAKEAGKVIMTAISDREKRVSEKTSATDLVTETDEAVEKLIKEKVKRNFPHHEFIGEETSNADEHGLLDFGDAPTWIVDPIDGTMNFIHGNPNVAVSIAVAVNKRVQVGLIYLPAFDLMYSASRGKGCKVNGKAGHVSDCVALNKAMVIFDLWANSGRDIEKAQIGFVAGLMPHTHAIRSIGSAAVSLALVAAGQADAFVHSGIHVWDIAAGALLVQEAGGVVLDPETEAECDLMSRRILVASTKRLADDFFRLKLKMMHFEPEFNKKVPL